MSPWSLDSYPKRDSNSVPSLIWSLLSGTVNFRKFSIEYSQLFSQTVNKSYVDWHSLFFINDYHFSWIGICSNFIAQWYRAMELLPVTQRSRVRNRTKTSFVRKYFDQWGQPRKPQFLKTTKWKVRFPPWTSRQDETLLSQHLQAWTVNSLQFHQLPGHKPSTP